MTIADALDAPDPEAYATGVQRWARSTWEAYAPLHGLARESVARHLPPD